VTAANHRAVGESADARCPHLLYRDVLGPELVAQFVDYVIAREADFTSATVGNGETASKRVDAALRDCHRLADLGPFKAPLQARLERIGEESVRRLDLSEQHIEAREFEIDVYRDGGHFAQHIDTFEQLNRVRILSCVYYFARTPRRFGGGELRLHGLPVPAGKMPPSYVDIVPETDSLVVFPSWLRHEVLPVRVPSGSWGDARFTVTCWIHRLSPVDGRR